MWSCERWVCGARGLGRRSGKATSGCLAGAEIMEIGCSSASASLIVELGYLFEFSPSSGRLRRDSVPSEVRGVSRRAIEAERAEFQSGR